MSEIKLSLFASAVRPHLWKNLLNSLKSSQYQYEVVFSGFIDEELWKPFVDEYQEFKYIQTGDIKPTQNYFIASKYCTGELIGWTADDTIYSEGYIDKVYNYWKSFNNKKLLISCRTNENGNNETMLNHRFFGRNQNTPIMAPLGVMSREYFWELGGYDRRYIAGQAENDIAMRVYANGGKIEIFNEACIAIDHKNMHGSETNFWNGYNEDRETLQNSWVIGGYVQSPESFFMTPKNPKEWFEFEKDKSKFWYIPLDNTEVTLKRNDKHEPYTFSDEMLLKKSEGKKGQWQ